MYAFLICVMRATYPSHLTSLDFMSYCYLVNIWPTLYALQYVIFFVLACLLIGPNILHFPAVSLLSSNIFRPPVACLIGTDCLANTLYTVAPAVYVGSH